VRTKFWWNASAIFMATILLQPQAVWAERASEMPFSDIGKHWAKAAILRGVEEGLFAESRDGQFQPNRPMTRAEFLALLDRLFYMGQQQLQPLTLMTDHYHQVGGSSFEEPYLPYTDVDRLTWMYSPILRVSVYLETLFGPNALQEVFPGGELKPSQPITQGEAARLLQAFTIASSGKPAWEEVQTWKLLNGEEADLLLRGEAAVMADKLLRYLWTDTVLPVLDMDGMKYPLVPEISEMFPYFAHYVPEYMTEDEKRYVDAVHAIRNREDDETTYEQLRALLQTDFPNKVGLHYFLSWDPHTYLEDNLNQAFLAIDAYFADRIVLPDTLRVLSANVYDIVLQMAQEDSDIYLEALQRFAAYEQKRPYGSEHEVFAVYLAAMEVRNGQVEKALQRYQDLGKTREGMLNTVHYLVRDKRLAEARKFVDGLTFKDKDPLAQLRTSVLQELDTLDQQRSIAIDLAYALRKFEQQNFRAEGESMLGGYLFKYEQTVDHERGAHYFTGFYQAPDKLVLDKVEMYTDTAEELEYYHDFAKQEWHKSPVTSLEFAHEWVESRSVPERLRLLQARYLKQSFGRYDVITEWIPGENISARANEIRSGFGRIKEVPMYVNKYYIDRESDMVVRHLWRYEEIYDNQRYMAYTGSENYRDFGRVNVRIPGDVSERAVDAR